VGSRAQKWPCGLSGTGALGRKAPGILSSPTKLDRVPRSHIRTKKRVNSYFCLWLENKGNRYINRRAHKHEIMALYKRVAEIRKFLNAEGYRRLAVNNEEGATII
jgi:hypothetical protein